MITSEFSEAGWVLNSVKEINNQGQIIGQATFMGGNHGVILNPVAPNYDYVKVGNISTFGDTVLLQGNEITLTGNFTASGDALAHDGNVVVDAKLEIVADNITADNGNVRLISEEKSVTATDITSGSETEGGNIILEGVEGVTTANLNARELGVVRITYGEIVEADTEGASDTIEIGSTITASITGKRVEVSSTGGFTAIGDITAHDGKVAVTTHDDIQTKKIESVTKSINLVSTDGEVTIDGELISGKGGISIVAKDDITTQKIDSADGVVGLSSFQGNVIVEDDITTVKGGVVIAGKAGVVVDDVTTGVGEVNIGSAGNIDVNGSISTSTGYIDIKTNASISAQGATTSKGFVSIAAGGVATANIATGIGTSTLISVANLDEDVLIAGDLDLILPPSITTAGELTELQTEIFTEYIKSMAYRYRPLTDFVLGALYEWAYSNGDEIRGLMPGFLKLDEREEALLNDRLNQSQAFELGRLLGEGAAIAQGIYEFIVGSAAVGGGGGLCLTTGVGCFAAAPAIATGTILATHGGTLAVNSASEFGEKLRDIISPNRMASSGGADDVIGLSRETGINQGSVEKVYNDLDPSDIKLIGKKIDKNLAEHLFNKGGDNSSGSQLIKDVSNIIDKFNKDTDAIGAINAAIAKSKRGRINDMQLKDAFSKTVDFSDRYKGKISGDFPDRFIRAEGKNTVQKVQAQSEIDLATDFLEEKTRLKDFEKVKGIPESQNQDGIFTPDYKLIFGDGKIRLAESKAPDGFLNRNNFYRNLRKAINQLSIKESNSLKGYIRLDYKSSPTDVSSSKISEYVSFILNETRTLKSGKQVTGTNEIEFVEVLYKDNSGQLKDLFFQVKNGKINLLP